MKLWVFRTICNLIAFCVGYALSVWLPLTGWQSVLIGIVCGIFGGVGFAALYGLVALRYLSVWWQRPIYQAWKERIKKIQTSPLVDYPMHIFVEFKLDEHFARGGMLEAQKQLYKYVEEMPGRMTAELTKFADERRKVLEFVAARHQKAQEKTPTEGG